MAVPYVFSRFCPKARQFFTLGCHVKVPARGGDTDGSRIGLTSSRYIKLQWASRASAGWRKVNGMVMVCEARQIRRQS